MNRLFSRSSAPAQTIVVPNNFANTETEYMLGTAPFNNPSRYQQIFDANQFPASPGGILISKIAFRPGFAQESFRRKITSIQFNLSTTKQSLNGLDAAFSRNIGGNEAVVYRGSITFRASVTNRKGAFNYDILVTLEKPFLYNPADGNLLLDIRDFTGDGIAFFVASTVDATTRLVYADTNPTLAQAGRVQPGGMITQFTYTPVTK
ncbi:hypothetical protein [Armatimonas rosea]|uniref:Uncharacterized protein n=1 Tax=Armatimonas rosea TaxID=685828 RepID=A0A7W9W848_ARMRO|nr:hypothetical protein [Armatimonas rosea]MBB6053134.1 hypothetical protein [Armatimonas rosea]